MELKICHLYPDVLNLYGDRGNIQCLQRRLAWRGIDCQVDFMGIGDYKSLSGYDLFFIGGGQDFDQEILLEDLRLRKGAEIRAALEDGKTFLCICGGYQMMIGNYAFRLGEESGGSIVVGFENHSGRTFLGSGVHPLGRILKTERKISLPGKKARQTGYGNNGVDRTEGARYRNAFCTYSHGPVLPKNPAFADILLETALQRKYGFCSLEPLPDGFEGLAHDSVLKRVIRGELS